MRTPVCANAEAAINAVNANPRSAVIICFFICPPFSVMWAVSLFRLARFPKCPGDKTRTRPTPRLVYVASSARASLNAEAAHRALQSWFRAAQKSYQRVIKELLKEVMASPFRQLYEFGPYRLHASERQVSRGGGGGHPEAEGPGT